MEEVEEVVLQIQCVRCLLTASSNQAGPISFIDVQTLLSSPACSRCTDRPRSGELSSFSCCFSSMDLARSPPVFPLSRILGRRCQYVSSRSLRVMYPGGTHFLLVAALMVLSEYIMSTDSSESDLVSNRKKKTMPAAMKLHAKKTKPNAYPIPSFAYGVRKPMRKLPCRC